MPAVNRRAFNELAAPGFNYVCPPPWKGYKL
jgi:hypothetical protein